MVKIIADFREKSGLIKELWKKKIDVERKQLLVGDFIIQGEDCEGKPVSIGIERKTQNDFINSIIDKRIVIQLSQLKENFDVALLILEGDENLYEIRDFHPNAIRGMLASITLDDKIPIIYTKNYRDSAAFIALISKRLGERKKIKSVLDKKKPLSTKELQEYIVESLPGVGPTLAKSLLKNFSSIKDILNASEEDLKKVNKLGPKKAKKIKSIAESKYS